LIPDYDIQGQFWFLITIYAVSFSSVFVPDGDTRVALTYEDTAVHLFPLRADAGLGPGAERACCVCAHALTQIQNKFRKGLK